MSYTDNSNTLSKHKYNMTQTVNVSHGHSTTFILKIFVMPRSNDPFFFPQELLVCQVLLISFPSGKSLTPGNKPLKLLLLSIHDLELYKTLIC